MSTYNMTDKELIELAAKAAGYSTAYYFDGEFMGADRYEFWEGPHGWNPLTSDGDALRLAVKLHFSVLSNETTSWVAHGMMQMNISEEHHGGKDPYAATRRAIVRAAASLASNLNKE